jgi:hypothetical protein
MNIYKFDINKYNVLVKYDKENTNISLIKNIFKSFNVNKFIYGDLIQSLLHHIDKFPNIKYQLEYVAFFLIYKFLINENENENKNKSEQINTLNEKLDVLWDKINKKIY